MTEGAVAIRSRSNSRVQPLLDDLQVQEPEKAAAEAEAERRARLHLVGKAGVVQPELSDRGAQILEIRGVDRKEPAEHHRLRRPETRQRLGGRAAVVGDGVADARVRHLLDGAGEEADLARAELADVDHLRREDSRRGRPRGARRCASCGSPGPSSARRRRCAPARRRRDRRRTSCRRGAPSAAPCRRPSAAGRRCTIASSTSSTPCPVLAEISTASEASRPITSSICCLMRSGSAAGRSILLRTGTISWSLSIAW